MSEQLQLVNMPTGRKALVLDAIRSAGDAGLQPDEVGALLHAYDGNHDAGERCEWCGRDGVRLLRALHRDRLVTRRHGNAAVAVEPIQAASATRPSAMSDGIPF